MAAVTIHSDFRAQEEEICHCFHLFPFCLTWGDRTRCQDISFFLIVTFKPAFSLSSFTSSRVLFSFSSLSAITVVSSAYLRLLIFVPSILIPGCTSSRLAFHMICSVYKLNKQSDNKQPYRTPFSILNQSLVPYRVLTVASTVCYDPHSQRL